MHRSEAPASNRSTRPKPAKPVPIQREVMSKATTGTGTSFAALIPTGTATSRAMQTAWLNELATRIGDR
jgi:hypothetical protein